MAIRTASPLQVTTAVILAFLAGVVDAIGFSRLGGLFVSFMSGNSTRLGLFISERNWDKVAEVGGIIAAFVMGAAFGFALARRTGGMRQPAVLIAEAILLAAAAAAGGTAIDAVCAMLMAAAMGLENATFLDQNGRTTINLTFVTGALVKVGEGIASAFAGGPRWIWARDSLVWFGLSTGAVVGARAYTHVGLDALWAVSGILLVLAVTVVVVRDPEIA